VSQEANGRPLVSVVIPAFNAAETVARAITSVLEQNYRPLELIVVDDASTDGTAEVVQSFISQGVQLIRLSITHGAAGARNAAIFQAKGKYLAFLDSDDAWLPDKLKVQVDMMEDDDDLRILTCDTLCIYGDDKISRRCHEVLPPVGGKTAWKTLLAYMFIPTSSVLVRRQDLIELGGFDPKLVVGEDLDLWIRLALKGKVGIAHQLLVHKYERPNSLMNSSKDGEVKFVLPMIENYLQMYEHRLSRNEIRMIRGQRYFETGYNLLYDRLYLSSVPLFWRSFLLRYRPLKSLSNLPKAVMLALVVSMTQQRWISNGSIRLSRKG
jgi:glycosyltransferase involved in cell wall biosynthesis